MAVTPLRFAASVCALLSTVAVATPADALTIRTSIPELIGDFAPNPSIRIDLGAGFREIDRVEITITASGTPDLFRTCGPAGCFESTRQPGIVIRLENALTDTASFIEAQATFTSEPSTYTTVRPNSFGAWDFLLDGEARIETRWNRNEIFGTSTQLASATLFVTQANLTVTGTPVPEPGTAVLLGGGLVLLSRSGRRSCDVLEKRTDSEEGA